MPRGRKSFLNQSISNNSVRQASDLSFLQRLQKELNLNQSYLNLALGALIILVAGILVFNYFRKSTGNIGPAQQTTQEELQQKDVEPKNLPGKYIVKEGDTLFKIAQFYYNDGYLFPKLAEANKLSDVNDIRVSQVLDIPTIAPTTSLQPIASPTESTEKESNGKGGAINQTPWGETITGTTYIVVEGDWLSKIAGRAYGDVMAFDKIAKTNNITNPDLIYPGTVLKISR